MPWWTKSGRHFPIYPTHNGNFELMVLSSLNEKIGPKNQHNAICFPFAFFCPTIFSQAGKQESSSKKKMGAIFRGRQKTVIVWNDWVWDDRERWVLWPPGGFLSCCLKEAATIHSSRRSPCGNVGLVLQDLPISSREVRNLYFFYEIKVFVFFF